MPTTGRLVRCACLFGVLMTAAVPTAAAAAAQPACPGGFPFAPRDVAWAYRSGVLTVVWVRASVGEATSWILHVGSTPGASDVLTQEFDGGHRSAAVNLAPGTYWIRVQAKNDCGTSNASGDVRVTAAEPGPAPVVINEVGNFVELLNVSAATVNVGGWRLYGSKGNTQEIVVGAVIPDLTFIRPGCTLLLSETPLANGVPRDIPLIGLDPTFVEGLALVGLDRGAIDQIGRNRNDDVFPLSPFREGSRLLERFSLALGAIRSVSRTNGIDTDDNRADFSITEPPTPHSLSACAGVPVPPYNLAAVVAGTTATLSWEWASGGVASDRFQIEVGSTPGAANLAVAMVPIAHRGMVFTDVPPGTYYVRVRSVAGSNQSAASNEVIVHVGSGQPTLLPGPPLAFSYARVPPHVLLTWLPPSSGAAPVSYVLEAGTGPGLANLGTFETGNAGVALMVGHVPPGVYYARLRARNAAGLGPPSTELVIVVP